MITGSGLQNIHLILQVIKSKKDLVTFYFVKLFLTIIYKKG